MCVSIVVKTNDNKTLYFFSRRFNSGHIQMCSTYIFSQIMSFFFTVNLVSQGHLLVGKFTFTGGEFGRAGGDFPHQFIS